MNDLTGKRLGKLVILSREPWPDGDLRRRKYGPWSFKVKCDCGTEKHIPCTGFAGLKSCGCSRNNYHQTTANETIRHTPNRVTLGSVREQVYTDI